MCIQCLGKINMLVNLRWWNELIITNMQLLFTVIFLCDDRSWNIMLQSWVLCHFYSNYIPTHMFKYNTIPMLMGSLVRKMSCVCLWGDSSSTHSSINAEFVFLCIWAMVSVEYEVSLLIFGGAPVIPMKCYKFASITYGKLRHWESVL